MTDRAAEKMVVLVLIIPHCACFGLYDDGFVLSMFVRIYGFSSREKRRGVPGGTRLIIQTLKTLLYTDEEL